jgi:hypothetical protein
MLHIFFGNVAFFLPAQHFVGARACNRHSPWRFAPTAMRYDVCSLVLLNFETVVYFRKMIFLKKIGFPAAERGRPKHSKAGRPTSPTYTVWLTPEWYWAKNGGRTAQTLASFSQPPAAEFQQILPHIRGCGMWRNPPADRDRQMRRDLSSMHVVLQCCAHQI